jgi:hypothetical protein
MYDFLFADTSVCSDMSTDYAIPPDASPRPAHHGSADLHSMDGSSFRLSSAAAGAFDSPRKSAEKALEKSGYLTKLGGKIKSWRKRYFMLKNGTLSYWKSQVNDDE